MRTMRIIAAALSAVLIFALTACADGVYSDSSITSEAADIVTEEVTRSSSSSAQTTTQRAPEDIAVTDEIVLPVSDILFSDSFDHDGDGNDEKFIFLNVGANIDGDTIVAVYYSEEDKRPAEFSRFEMETRLLSDGFFVETINQQRIVGAVTDIAMGAGMPAVCFTVVDKVPQQVGEELTFVDSSQPFLTYSEYGLMVRQCGPAAGVNDLYPIYWSGELRICDTSPVDMSFVHEADVNGIVQDVQNVTSAFIRTNGLLHINYIAEDGSINSITYIMDGTQIKELYDPDVHGELGRFLPSMEVKQFNNHILAAAPEIAYTQQEIQTLLSDFGSFCYSYVDGKAFRLGNGYDTSDFITETFTREDGSTYKDIWYRVTDDTVTSYQALITLGSQYCTEDMLHSIKYILDQYYKEQNGKLYVWQHTGSGGSLLGTDYAYITSVEQDGWSLVVHMNAFGSKESWDTEVDFSEEFEVRLKHEDSTLKVDSCGIRERDYIAYAYDPAYDCPVQ